MKASMLAKGKFWLLAFLLGLPLAASAQDLEINETNFPDKNFRNYLLEQNYGADGILTAEEIEGITYMDVWNRDITSLKGIEYFTALTSFSCNNNKLTTLDVSQNTKLIELYCAYNQLTTLNVSNNTALMYLYCYDNLFTELDVSTTTALVVLNCCNNNLTALDVSCNTRLSWLFCYNNQLTALDVSKNTLLQRLYCYNNKIKGASMNALIASLPENTTNEEYPLQIYNSVNNDGNVCTRTQVAAAKAKGWTPYWYNNEGLLVEYEGIFDSDPMAITRPVAETVDAGAPAYTLSGQKVTGSLKDKKGVYIIGGKKVVVK